MRLDNNFVPRKICTCNPLNQGSQVPFLQADLLRNIRPLPNINLERTATLTQPNFCDQCGASLVVKCSLCDGQGGKICPICHGVKVGTCATCNGSGKVRVDHQQCSYLSQKYSQIQHQIDSGNNFNKELMYCTCDCIPFEAQGVKMPYSPFEPPIRVDLNALDRNRGSLSDPLLNTSTRARFCSQCGVTLVQSCNRCGGSKYLHCEKCGKWKRGNCPNCNGTGEIYSMKAMHSLDCPANPDFYKQQ